MSTAIYYNIATSFLITLFGVIVFFKLYKQRGQKQILYFSLAWLFIAFIYLIQGFTDAWFLAWDTAFGPAHQFFIYLLHIPVPIVGYLFFLFIFTNILKKTSHLIIGLIIFSIAPIYFYFSIFTMPWPEVIISQWGTIYQPPEVAIIPFLIGVVTFTVLLLRADIAYLYHRLKAKTRLPLIFWPNLSLIFFLLASLIDEPGINIIWPVVLARMFMLIAVCIAFFCFKPQFINQPTDINRI